MNSELYEVLHEVGLQHRIEEIRAKFWGMDVWDFEKFLDDIIPDRETGERIIEALRWESRP